MNIQTQPSLASVSDLAANRHCRLLLLAATLLVLLLALPSAKAQSSCYRWDFRVSFWMPDSGFVKGSKALYDNSSCAGVSVGTISFGKYGSVWGGSRSSAAATCNSQNGFDDMYVKPFGSVFWSCARDSKGDSRGGSSSSSSGGSSSGSNADWHQPAPIHVTKLPIGSVMVNAELGLNSGIVFERFDHYAVGIQKVANMGILDVVDVWGQANQRYEVCFPQKGKVVFLDASTSPRSVVHVSNFTRDGYSCAAMTRAGTMVLVESTGAAPSSDLAIAQSFIDATTDPVSSAIDLDNCLVTPQHKLNLRAEPWGEILDVVRKNTTVTAIARTKSWFKVRFERTGESEDDLVETIDGWLAAWYSQAEGDCSFESDEDDNGPALASNSELSEEEFTSTA